MVMRATLRSWAKITVPGCDGEVEAIVAAAGSAGGDYFGFTPARGCHPPPGQRRRFTAETRRDNRARLRTLHGDECQLLRYVLDFRLFHEEEAVQVLGH